MDLRLGIGIGLSLLLAGNFSVWGQNAAQEQGDSLPPPASHQVDFSSEIKPILKERCTQCHGKGKSKSGFRINTRETLLEGGNHDQPAVVPGKSRQSLLIKLVAGQVPDMPQMPKKGKRLTDKEIGLLRAWIDQGVEWEEGFAFDRPTPKNLFPRDPKLPSSPKKGLNPIDRWLKPYFAKHDITPPDPVGDRRFARRAYLDIMGLVPPPQELKAFLANEDPNKREKLVDKLLGRDQEYAEHWLSFWNDLFRNDYTGPGYIDGGREQITSWLYKALAKNMPYDTLVDKLVDPTPQSRGFVKGIVWRGAVNASQTPAMQAGRNVSQIFMGVKLKCASCHNSFIDNWRLVDSYGMAGIYAKGPLEMVRCGKPTGKKAQPKFLFPQLGKIDSDADRDQRMKQLADIITSAENGRFSRTVVNRIWAELMGRGLVEPLDVMNNKAWHQDLLDWLAADFVEHEYDLKHLLRRIITSRAYQLPGVSLEKEGETEYVFQGPTIRRLTAEQQVDSLAAITGAWKKWPANRKIDFNAGSRDSEAPSPRYSPVKSPKWIWSDSDAAKAAEPGAVYFRKAFKLPEVPTQAAAVCTADNAYTLYVNGKKVESDSNLDQPELIDLRPHLRTGKNLFAVKAKNGKPSEEKQQSNPAGFLFYARFRDFSPGLSSSHESIWDVRSDATWRVSKREANKWRTADFDDSKWERASEVGNLNAAPWGYKSSFLRLYACAAQYRQTRASLVANDPLMQALGRPGRAHVATSREMAASTLQALELTNGATLNQLLKRGAQNLATHDWQNNRQLARKIYRHALSRLPTERELALASEAIGSPIRREGVQDLLWAVMMLPEFQLVY